MSMTNTNFINSINDTNITIISRKSYLSGSSSHAEYYGQFDSPEVRRAILNVIPMSHLMASTDPHFNDIKLSHWDAIRLPKVTRCMLSAANGHETSIIFSHSDAVCLAKMVATRIIAELLAQPQPAC